MLLQVLLEKEQGQVLVLEQVQQGLVLVMG